MLVKQAADDTQLPVVYDKISKTTLETKFDEEAIQSWQNKQNQTPKGKITRSFLPSITNRLKQNVPLTR